MKRLPVGTWTEKARAHKELVSPIADAFLKRRGLGETHAVHDFLFTYYSCPPAKLKQWIPSFEEGLILEGSIREDYPWLNDYWFSVKGDALFLNPDRMHKNACGLAGFIADLCEKILKRPPRFGCFGLHEWAMVYKLPENALRHKKESLRLSQNDLSQFVESQTICCSHYDAYRFFTKDARPLNVLNPLLETRLQMEQGGCVHANMDLYKWASKLWPWIGSDFLAKTFFLAIEGRELDMRASPYDLTHEGFEPILIETEEGRREYQKCQQLLTAKSTPLREELKQFCRRFQESFKEKILID